jgi:Ohr subfamily peroxiredoxin
MKTLYAAHVRSAGGREKGAARSSDGRLDIRLSTPGGPGTGTNPEQLLAAGWSACFASAIGIAARNMNIALPAEVAIDAEVSLLQSADGYTLAARLHVRLPGLDRGVAEALVAAAHETCPYSRATRGNIDVVVALVEPGPSAAG